jgi:hypothetical protein
MINIIIYYIVGEPLNRGFGVFTLFAFSAKVRVLTIVKHMVITRKGYEGPGQKFLEYRVFTEFTGTKAPDYSGL